MHTLPPGLRAVHPAAWLSTWFFSGLLPAAPGTWGSLAALPFAWAIAALAGHWILLPAAAAVFLLGLWAAEVYLRHDGTDDPGAVVVDEVAGQWVTLAAVPPDPLVYALGFLLFRIADIVKPWPIRTVERRVKGALGVLLDDVLAGIAAGAGLWLAVRYLLPFLEG